MVFTAACEKGLSVDVVAEGRVAMFRFICPWVMASFAMSLSATEGAAFIGSGDRMACALGETLGVRSQFDATITGYPMRSAPKHFIRILPAQYQAVEEVATEQFRDDLFRFFRKVFAAEIVNMDDDTLRHRIDQAIADTERQEMSREQDILKMSAVRILRPDLTQDDWIWNQVMTHETEDPKMRASLFLGYLKYDLDAAARELFEAKLGLFGVPGVY